MKTPGASAQLGVLCLLATFLYLPALSYPFLFDDHLYLLNNPLYKDIARFWGILTDFSGTVHSVGKLGYDGDIAANFVLRPLTYFSFWINHVLGGARPEGYRLLNVCIHIGNAFLVFEFGRLLSVKLPAPGSSHSLLPFLPSVASILFFVHPLQIESVTYVIQRLTSLNALLFLASLYCHRRAWLAGEAGSWKLASWAACLGAMLTKESGAMIPAFAVLVDRVIWAIPLRSAVWRARHLLVLLPVVPTLVGGVAMVQKGDFSLKNIFNVSHGETHSDYGACYLLTQPAVWIHSLRLFFWPSGLNADPDIPLVRNIFEIRFLLPLTLALGSGCAAGWLALRSPELGKRFIPAALGLGWFLLAQAPSSLFPLPDVMAEHRVYLSLAGLCLGIPASLLLLAEKLLHSPGANRWGLRLGLVVCGALCLCTQRRQTVWSSEELFWGEICLQGSKKLRPWLNYAAALAESGKTSHAEEAYNTCIKMQPTGLGYANLARLHLVAGNIDKALQASLGALNCASSGYDFCVLGVIGECYFRLQKWGDCVPYLEASLRSSPGYFPSLKLLGVAHLAMQNPGAARAVFERALQFHPHHPELLAGLNESSRLLQTASPGPGAPPAPVSSQAAEPFKLRLGLSN